MPLSKYLTPCRRCSPAFVQRLCNLKPPRFGRAVPRLPTAAAGSLGCRKRGNCSWKFAESLSTPMPSITLALGCPILPTSAHPFRVYLGLVLKLARTSVKLNVCLLFGMVSRATCHGESAHFTGQFCVISLSRTPCPLCLPGSVNRHYHLIQMRMAPGTLELLGTTKTRATTSSFFESVGLDAVATTTLGNLRPTSPKTVLFSVGTSNARARANTELCGSRTGTKTRATARSSCRC